MPTEPTRINLFASGTVECLTKPDDSQSIVELMLQLAEFEGYADQFKVNAEDLREILFAQKLVSVLVAEHENNVIGILAYYYLPFSYDMTPWIYIKDFYICSDFRSFGCGALLLGELKREGRVTGVSRLRWEVIATNTAAQRFYQFHGAIQEQNWLLYSMDL